MSHSFANTPSSTEANRQSLSLKLGLRIKHPPRSNHKLKPNSWPCDRVGSLLPFSHIPKQLRRCQFAEVQNIRHTHVGADESRADVKGAGRRVRHPFLVELDQVDNNLNKLFRIERLK